MRVDIDKNYHLVKGQGHLVKGQGQICGLLKKHVFWNNSWTIGRTLTKLGMRVYIGENYPLAKGQGRLVKGQAQIHDFMNNWFW